MKTFSFRKTVHGPLGLPIRCPRRWLTALFLVSGVWLLGACATSQLYVRSDDPNAVRLLSAEISGPSSRDLMVAVVSLLPWREGVLLTSDRDRLYEIDVQTEAFVNSLGRMGEGPGEFRHIEWVGMGLADTLVVYDQVLRRFTHIAMDLGFRTEPVALPGSDRIYPVCLLDSEGVVAIAKRHIATPSGETIAYSGLSEEEQSLRVYDRVDKSELTLDSLITEVRWIGIVEVNQGPARIPIRSAPTIPFAPASFVRCDGRALYWGHGSEPVVHRFQEGRIETISLDGLVTSTITDEDRQQFVDTAAMADGSFGARDLYQDAMRARTYSQFPHFVDLRIAANGSIWVLLPHRHRLEGESKGWRVYSPMGNFQRDVLLPSDFELRLIADDALWGVQPGPLGDLRVVRRGIN